MPLLKGKFARISAVGLSATALVVGLLAPSVVMGQSITLHKCNGLDDSNCLSSIQIAVPTASQIGTQTASLGSPNATSDQSNSTTQSTSNHNDATLLDALGQAQKNVQVGGDQSNRVSSDPRLVADPSVDVGSGDSKAVGPIANVSFHLSQSSDASIHGSATAVSDTGDAGGNATASGAVTSSAGDANGHASADGGNGNGNSKASDVAAQIKSGTAWLPPTPRLATAVTLGRAAATPDLLVAMVGTPAM
jgi:hypothetical protein